MENMNKKHELEALKLSMVKTLANILAPVWILATIVVLVIWLWGAYDLSFTWCFAPLLTTLAIVHGFRVYLDCRAPSKNK